ncbi:hypothetical protein LQG66_26485 [Bradyrhizobium ontarionense]|uniref:Uncharacterized protein n=1 Tax=Bradyrhizobium ontarionense TaxID=2898149 RepID=A0ABY3R7Q2_9BRAD|nr:hypothetical protein [Bradyrhizobium sp. A19]UFZ02793.1 hypothetical protein LQG66_26485 [Bradyrhizobium sp. A19]
MFVALIRDKSATFPDIDNPESITALKIWSCSFRSFSSLSSFPNLRELTILAYPDPSFDHIAQCSKLVSLSVCHFPNAHDLAPLQRLSNLVSLSLATLPSWDSSGKVQAIDALEPLARIDALQHLELFGVRPLDRSLSPLKSCKNLRSLRCSKYPKTEIERFYAETGCSNERCPPPTLIRE